MIDIVKESPIRVREAAKLMGVCNRTIKKWFVEGLESVRKGKLLYTTREALQRFDSTKNKNAEPSGIDLSRIRKAQRIEHNRLRDKTISPERTAEIQRELKRLGL